MKINLQYLVIRTRQSIERIQFTETVTFLHGPVSTGKSTVARLIDYCFGGDLERTPAIQRELISVELGVRLGDTICTIERAAEDTQSIRVSWLSRDDTTFSVNAPLTAQEEPLLEAEVFNFSDLVFYLCDVTPIKVRQRSRDPDSPMIRLSIRDILWYCYLEQMHLDSSFFRLEDPFRGRKSQDAMRFFTGLHSERLSQLETDLMRIIDDQRTKRESVHQIRSFMMRFDLGSELELVNQLNMAEEQLGSAKLRRAELEQDRSSETHPVDPLRTKLRSLSLDIEEIHQAIFDAEEALNEQQALRSELITAKIKAQRVTQASRVLDGVKFLRCPECGTDLSDRAASGSHCRLCSSEITTMTESFSMEEENIRRDLNERIDQLADSIERRGRESARMKRQLAILTQQKEQLDKELQEMLSQYDSSYVSSIREIEKEIATQVERIIYLKKLQQMPAAVNALEVAAGALQGRIDGLRTSIAEEKEILRSADENIKAISNEFKRILLAVSFPGFYESDQVVLDPRNWKPTIIHDELEWTFWDTGSGGKKTLFNVCYALAIHSVALEKNMPVPNILIIDSPTKNISEDENPDLVTSLYAEIYEFANNYISKDFQFILIDSDMVLPNFDLPGFSQRRMAGTPDAPSLIPYYSGP